ncbi:MAG: hypothetical protein SRB1_00317 [Desulfobacteraceae bacterium Eth-SRB1]|nr:MAG: hypothetical protein SRB1_00317 [Desulfobacteraceae bacterium Eth-SRB1]
MQTLTTGELRTGFSEILRKIRSGQKIVIISAKNGESCCNCPIFSLCLHTGKESDKIGQVLERF